MRRLSFAAITCWAVLLAAPGCGGVNHTPVSGVVTLDGQPHGDVLITFLPADGSGGLSASGRADENGKFQMGTETSSNGVKPGKYKVTVAPGPPKDSKATGHPSEAFLQKAQPAGGKVDADKAYRKLEGEGNKASKKTHPSIYADPARTPLEVEVTKEPKDVKLELKSDAK
jgi:hypothetical protein